jgi:NAD(P)-dependent dehydrogenase (short-subunit alcohol dehydrogenase family)
MPTTIITGGTGGLATATAIRLLTDEVDRHVALIDVHGATIGAALNIFGDRVRLFSGDVSSPDAVTSLAEQIRQTLPVVDGLVNTAGIVANTPSLTMPADEFERMMAIHVTGTLLWSQAAAHAMTDGGSIVNLGSVAGLFGHPRRVAYSSAKGAIHSMTRTLAVEWAERGIRVNAVAPGVIETPLVAEARRLGLVDESAAAHHAMKRLGTPDEVAGVICFLLGPDSTFVTGIVLPVDGGFSALKLE